MSCAKLYKRLLKGPGSRTCFFRPCQEKEKIFILFSGICDGIRRSQFAVNCIFPQQNSMISNLTFFCKSNKNLRFSFLSHYIMGPNHYWDRGHTSDQIQMVKIDISASRKHTYRNPPLLPVPSPCSLQARKFKISCRKVIRVRRQLHSMYYSTLIPKLYLNSIINYNTPKNPRAKYHVIYNLYSDLDK